MNAKYLIVAMIETIIKIAILAAVVVFVFRGATQAYDFGYRVFADQPVSVSGGRTIHRGFRKRIREGSGTNAGGEGIDRGL